MKALARLLCYFMLLTSTAMAAEPIAVVTTTADIAAIVKAIGGNRVGVESIAKGYQDPHFVEAKPSFVRAVNRARMLFNVGLELEVGWLPLLIQGGRNPSLVIVARAEDPAGARRLERAGATRTISTYDIGGHRMAHFALHPRVIDFVDMLTDAAERQMSVVEVAVARGSAWVGKTLHDVDVEQAGQVVILGAVPAAGGRMELGARGKRPLEAGDVVGKLVLVPQ